MRIPELRRLVPGAKVLFVIRDLHAVARSAKARRFWRTPVALVGPFTPDRHELDPRPRAS